MGGRLTSLKDHTWEEHASLEHVVQPCFCCDEMITWTPRCRCCLLWAVTEQSVLILRGMLKKGGVQIKGWRARLPVVKEWCQGRPPDISDGALSSSVETSETQSETLSSHVPSIGTLNRSCSPFCKCQTLHESPDTNPLLLISHDCVTVWVCACVSCTSVLPTNSVCSW